MRIRYVILVALLALSALIGTAASADTPVPEPRILVCVNGVCVEIPG